MIRHLTAILLAILGPLALRAQSVSLMSHYFEVPALYNPGSIGTTDYLTLRGAGRLQWTGADNAPKIFAGVVDMPVAINRLPRLAVGATVMHESMELFSNTSWGIMLGYPAKIGKGTLTIGLKGGMATVDPDIPSVDTKRNLLDLGAGINYHRDRFDVGVSLLHATGPVAKFEADKSATPSEDTSDESSDATQNYEFQLKRTLYFSTSGNIPVNNTLIEVLPGIIAATDFDSWTGVATLMARWKRLIRFGTGYRWKDAVIIYLGVDYRNFYLGYSYDYPVGHTSRAGNGSHELTAGYRVKLNLARKSKFKQKSIRLM